MCFHSQKSQCLTLLRRAICILDSCRWIACCSLRSIRTAPFCIQPHVHLWLCIGHTQAAMRPCHVHVHVHVHVQRLRALCTLEHILPLGSCKSDAKGSMAMTAPLASVPAVSIGLTFFVTSPKGPDAGAWVSGTCSSSLPPASMSIDQF